MHEQPVARLGQHESGRSAIEQLGVERLLELGDAPAYSAVIDLQTLGSGREAPLPRQLQEKAEVVPVKQLYCVRMPASLTSFWKRTYSDASSFVNASGVGFASRCASW